MAVSHPRIAVAPVAHPCRVLMWFSLSTRQRATRLLVSPTHVPIAIAARARNRHDVTTDRTRVLPASSHPSSMDRSTRPTVYNRYNSSYGPAAVSETRVSFGWEVQLFQRLCRSSAPPSTLLTNGVNSHD